ncbi:MAG: arylsulfatase [Bacteroidota bacterium]
MRILLLLAASCALTACASRPSPDAPAERPPNIIFIMADDLGYGDLGSYGQTQIQTPHLDQMAAEGLRFTQFYAGSTVCAPSRSVLMTGQHTGHTSVRGNGNPPEQSILPTDYTVAELLQDGGYATGLAGKWGLGSPEYGGLPNDEGFGWFYGYLNQVHAHNFYPEWLWLNQDTVRLANEVTRAPNSYGGFTGGYATKKVDYTHDLFMDESLAFVERHQAEPFFLYLALTIPHANNEARHGPEHGMEVPDYGPYANRDWPEPQKGHAAMITRMDDGIGQLRAQLEALGLADDTIVMFTSDNGPHREGGGDPDFFDSNGPLRGIKRALYEGGIRVPFIVWGGGIAPGVSDHIGYSGDVYATAADLAGLTPPDSIQRVLDSVSFAPLLRGNAEAQRQHEALYWEFYEQGSRQAVRKGSWKAIRQPMFTGAVELYNLDDDIGETTDVAGAHPEIVAEMQQLMETMRTDDPRWQVR